MKAKANAMKWLLLFYLLGSTNILYKGGEYSTEDECRRVGDIKMAVHNRNDWNNMIYYRCKAEGSANFEVRIWANLRHMR